MGQLVSVTKHQTATRGVLRFETNRALTGTGHESYVSSRPVEGNRPPDELARRLFAMGDGEQVGGVHVFGNIITVELAPHGADLGIEEIIRDLYTHYLPGVTPSL